MFRYRSPKILPVVELSRWQSKLDLLDPPASASGASNIPAHRDGHVVTKLPTIVLWKQLEEPECSRMS